jgi:hypothetical protein
MVQLKQVWRSQQPINGVKLANHLANAAEDSDADARETAEEVYFDCI